jgi:hypothetical protein
MRTVQPLTLEVEVVAIRRGQVAPGQASPEAGG